MNGLNNGNTNGMLEPVIRKVLTSYITAKRETFAGHPMGKFFRNDIPDAFYSSGLVDKSTHLVTGSVGQGNWATVPWICIFDRNITTSATKGVYIVYLLAKDGKTLYLTFNQGCTDISRNHSKRDTIQIMRDRARKIIGHLDSRGFRIDENINLGSGLTTLAELYQKGTIFYKAYHQESIPSEDELRNDLSNMMAIYADYSQMQSGAVESQQVSDTRVGQFDSWEIVDEVIAIKHCDKSFFEHNGSGVPKGICWFFDAENLNLGETRQITLLHNGKQYQGRVANESSDRRRVRIFWNAELGKVFAAYNAPGATATFKRISNDTYEITIKGGEAEMTVKEEVTAIKAYIAARGFNYEGDLIENFYLSLKSKPFVILAGTSGTGKTRLVKLFAEAIGARMKLVPVRPDWSDASDLFGYTDLSNHFHPGVIIEFIKRAEWDKDTPYFICLDEMNLARIEYYLSDFLSIIETRDRRENGKIETDTLIDTPYYKDPEAEKKFGRVYIPENLYIIGTVNMDETTFPFSKKVLDRANTIEFSFVNLLSRVATGGDPVAQKLSNDFLKTDYLYLRDCDDTELIDTVCFNLEELNHILVKANLHVGYRVRDEICFYMMTNKAADLLSEEAALDHEIMQKILPRVQGSSAAIKEVLSELFIKCAGDYSGFAGTAAYEQMNSYLDSKPCRYPNSAKKITFMMRRYEEDGFTSYWL